MKSVPDLWPGRCISPGLVRGEVPEGLCLMWENRSLSAAEPMPGLKPGNWACVWRITWPVFPHTRSRVG